MLPRHMKFPMLSIIHTSWYAREISPQVYVCLYAGYSGPFPSMPFHLLQFIIFISAIRKDCWVLSPAFSQT